MPAPEAEKPETQPRSPGAQQMAKTGVWALALGALGVVFGDIGTSPIYAMQTVFSSERGYPLFCPAFESAEHVERLPLNPELPVRGSPESIRLGGRS